MDIIINIAVFLISAVIFTFVGMFIRKKLAESKMKSAEAEAKKILDMASVEAENKKKEEIIKAKEEIMNARNELDQEIRERRGEVQSQERRLIQKEENLERKIEKIENKEKDLENQEKEILQRKQNLNETIEKQLKELQRISGLNKEEAKQILLSEMDKKLTAEKAQLVREKETELKEESDKKARELIGYAIQKCAADHTSETTVSIVALPNDEMKGRIIGREGRNIKALETLTGIDLIIDDTPEAVVISGFDPLRREVAKIALEKLIEDGRIHPAKIEEMVEKAKEEVSEIIKEAGERAIMETGVIGLHPDIIKLLGKLKYRTSYGQNVLNHSIEVSNLARIMAEELGLDPKLARRAGLLHDIGKALDHDMEGTHVEIGVEVLKKYKENANVINAVEAHHGDVEPQTIEAVLVQAADAISASRPGARRETLETYIKRLEELEKIADSFEGVEKSFAIQAGREIRIIVKPDKISDDKMTLLAKDVAKSVEDEMEYPGQIKINLIRETRVVDYAK
jgi:ribonuclease Y